MKPTTREQSNERLALLATLLDEVVAGTWTPSEYSVLVADWDDIWEELREEMLAGTAPMKPEETPITFALDAWGAAEECGFAACAVGHALLDKRFTDQGLGVWGRTGFQPSVDVELTAGEMAYHREGSSFTKTMYSWGGVQAFFGIRPEEATHLFSEMRYKSTRSGPKHVAARIREFLRERKYGK